MVGPRTYLQRNKKKKKKSHNLIKNFHKKGEGKYIEMKMQTKTEMDDNCVMRGKPPERDI